MGGLAERQIADAIRALMERDIDLAERVIATDPTIDAMQHEIEEKAMLTIARRQPMAVDLREIVGAMRVCNDLERIGDHAKHIGKRVVALDLDLHPQKLIRGVEHMALAGARRCSSRCSTPTPAAICRRARGLERRRGGRRALHRRCSANS